MEILLTRHGQTKTNVLDIITGQQGGELTEKGITQAGLLGKRLSTVTITHIFSSDLNRTRQTTAAIVDNLNQTPPITFTDQIREINVKSMENQPHQAEVDLRNKGDVPYRMSKLADDENYCQVFLRLSKFLDTLIKTYVKPSYSSGINDENNEAIHNNNDVIIDPEWVELFKKGELTRDESKTLTNLDKIWIVVHGGIVAEFVNNFWYRMNKKLVKMIDPGNVCLFSVKLYCPVCKGKCKESGECKDIAISFEIYDDRTHVEHLD